jgi:N-acyl-D-aspartate/D-glutamate deacylase
VSALSDAPARLFGLRGRGRVAAGHAADLVLFDPERVGCGEIRAASDLPGGAGRLVADPLGVERVLVNGRAVAIAGRPTGDLPGTVLRSQRDTAMTTLGSASLRGAGPPRALP